jgi:hypothetical protein
VLTSVKLKPNQTEAKELRNQIADSQQKSTIAIIYNLDHFGKLFGHAHYQFFQDGHITKYGNVMDSMNTSQQFDTSGIQPEIDFYTSYTNGFYGYLNYGISGTALYPIHRIGAALFKICHIVLKRHLNFGTCILEEHVM